MTEINTSESDANKSMSNPNSIRYVKFILASIAIYVLFFYLMYPIIGLHIESFYVLPVIISGWFLGLRSGLIAGMSVIPLNIFLYQSVDLSTNYIFTPDTLMIVLTGMIVGRLRDLRMSLKKELYERRTIESQLKSQHKELLVESLEIEKSKKELESKVVELNDTKAAMMNMLEDMDEANKNLVYAQSELKKDVKELKKLDVDKDKFISIAAHELKTPMTAIQGFAQLLESEKIFSNKEAKLKYLGIIKSETNRLSKLVTDILDLSRVDIGTIKFVIEDVDIRRLSDDVKDELLQKAAAKGLRLNFDIDGKLPHIKTDKERFKEVLVNLVDNAIKYTEKGGVTVWATMEDGNAKFAVADTGIGIPKESVGKIFSRFYQVSSTYTRKVGGTGLGLSICKELVEGLGGRIWFESKLGKGSTFYFTLPVDGAARNGK